MIIAKKNLAKGFLDLEYWVAFFSFVLGPAKLVISIVTAYKEHKMLGLILGIFIAYIILHVIGGLLNQ